MNKLHLIGNAHIDPVWLWRWTEGFQETRATFRSALDRMTEDPDFKFTASSSMLYEWVEESEPEMFAEIQARVAEGRWEITGGWLIEPDCNIPSGESFARQGLYGQRYFKEKFGKIIDIAYNPDSFGHNGKLPQIFRLQGMDKYVFMRPGDGEKDLPRVFRWQGVDGAEVLCYRIPRQYNSWGDELLVFCEQLYGELEHSPDGLMLFYGVGNHGGGPTKKNIQNLRRIDAENAAVDHVFSTTAAFLADAAKREQPVVTGDLQHHASGCYSLHSAVKAQNRRAEFALGAAEVFCTVASVLHKLAYPADFTRAWKNVLFNQFHDILAGTSLYTGYADARDMYGEAFSIAARNENCAVQAMARGICIPYEDDSTFPIVVHNPHAFGGKMVCEAEMRGLQDEKFLLLDEDDNIIPAQRIQSETIVFMGRLLFVADMPALGYRTFRLRIWQEKEQPFPAMYATDAVLENSFLRVEINPETGCIKSMLDMRSRVVGHDALVVPPPTHGVELLRRESARPVVISDKSDTWGHGVFTFNDEITDMPVESVRLVENGPVRSIIRVKYRYKDSFVTQDFRLYKDLPQLEVKLTADWREPFTMLKMKFAPDIDGALPTYEIPFGSITRTANGEEESGQTWVNFTGTKDGQTRGLALANTAKYSYAFTGDEMALTVLRNAVYAFHDPNVLDPAAEYEWTEHGVQSFLYTLLPHTGAAAHEFIRMARVLNRMPTVLPESFHDGPLPQKQSFIAVDNPQIIVTAVKQAEDGDGVIVRAYEAESTAADAEIKLLFMDRTVRARFAPGEIKTFKLPFDREKEAAEVNLLEW